MQLLYLKEAIRFCNFFSDLVNKHPHTGTIAAVITAQVAWAEHFFWYMHGIYFLSK